MIFWANFLLATAKIVHIILMVYTWVVILRVVFSWVRIPSLHSIAVVTYKLTEPALKPLRRILPPHRTGGFDISPMLLVLLILFVDSFVVKSISLYAYDILRKNTWSL
jgi:YggT family protein